tara:strand:- start:1310 stop:2707 length:1398 start_codon:yes stop_codon:yes gene_type:complete
MSNKYGNKYEIPMDPTYQEKVMNIYWAVRELIANARDAQRRGEGEMVVKYLPRTQTLRIATLGIQLPMSVLVLGTSGAREREDNIGQFGEGLIMSLKTLALLVRMTDIARMCDESDQRYTVKISNNTEHWTPLIEYSPKWGQEILTITTRKARKPSGEFSVTIKGISPEQWERIQRLFLHLDPDYDKDRMVKVGSQAILLQPEMAGRIYVKGVFVKQRDDMEYGYNLDMTLNRDRSLMDEWDLKWQLGRLLSQAMEAYPDKFKSKVLAMIESGDSMEAGSSYFAYSGSFVDAAVESFEEKHGPDAVPVSNMTEARTMSGLGAKSVVVSKAMKDLLEVRKGTLEDVEKRRSMRAKSTYSWDDLTPAEQENLNRVTTLVDKADLIEGDGSALDIIQVVDFASEEMLGRYDRGRNEIRLARKIVGNLKDLLKTTVHEVAHKMPGADDGTTLHADLQIDALCQIIVRDQ